MRSINKIILKGRIGHDPELIEGKSGKAFVVTSLATQESYKDEEGNYQDYPAEWHDLVFFNGLADIARNKIKKGSSVFLTGKVSTQTYQDREDNTRKVKRVIVQEIDVLSA